MASRFPDELKDLEDKLEQTVKKEKKEQAQHEPLTASCSLYIRPEFLPLKQMSYEKLVQTLAEQFSLSPDFDDLLRPDQPGPSDAHQMLQLADYAITNDKPLKFENGLLKIKNINLETILSSALIGSQSISATVSGTTTEAFHVCRLLLMAVWQSCAIQVEWDEVSNSIERASYRSSTISRLPINIKDFFRNELIEFLESEDGKHSACNMGLTDIKDLTVKFGVSDYAITNIFREIDIRVSRFNLKTGYHEEALVSITPDSYFDSNVGPLRFSTELPYTAHVEYINLLTGALGSK